MTGSYRYIPTRVGRLSIRWPHVSHDPVHPHACGAILGIGFDRTPQFGTSPRVWGDCNEVKAPTEVLRYIPTRVGRFTPER